MRRAPALSTGRGVIPLPGCAAHQMSAPRKRSAARQRVAHRRARSLPARRPCPSRSVVTLLPSPRDIQHVAAKAISVKVNPETGPRSVPPAARRTRPPPRVPIANGVTSGRASAASCAIANGAGKPSRGSSPGSQRDAQAIVAGPEVGSGGGDFDGDGCSWNILAGRANENLMGVGRRLPSAFARPSAQVVDRGTG